jgi:glycosyltransferase involved in cell wall biosynthesis
VKRSRLLEALGYAAATAFVVRQSLPVWRQDRALAEAYLARPPEPLPKLKSTPLISVIGLIWNHDDDVDGLVRSFHALDYPNKEIVLAVGGAHRLEDYRGYPPDVVFIPHPGGEGKVRGLDACFKAARGDIIYTVDGDCRILNPGFLRLIAPVVNGEEEITTSHWQPVMEQRRKPLVALQWAIHLRAEERHPYRKESLVGGSTVITRRALESIGGWSFESPIGDDRYLGILLGKAGYRARYQAEPAIEIKVHESFSAYFRQQTRQQRTPIMLAMRFREPKRALLPLRRFGLSAGVIVATFLAPFSGVARVVLYFQLLRDAQIQLRRLLEARRLGLIPWQNVFLPCMLAKLYTEYAASVAGMAQLLSPRARKRW